MGTYKGGPLSLFSGKVGDTVSYTTKVGYSVIRQIGTRIAPFTAAERANQKGTGLVTNFLNALLPVIRIGFQNVPAGKHWTAYNYASSILKLNSLKGSGLDKEINYKAVVLSVGDIPPPKSKKVELLSNKLIFEWEADTDSEKADRNDRVMIVAYFPETLQAIFLLCGATRTEERQIIPLPDFTRETVMETYISFVSDDRKSVSNSVYTGQVIGKVN